MAVTTDTVSGLQCHDWEGHLVEEGTQFIPDKGDPCMTCTCERGYPVTCRSVQCSPPDCAHYEPIEGECCRFLCIELPDHGQDVDINGTIIGIDPRTDGDIAHLGLRLVASTVTSFLILALLLYMVHRLRQRRMLIMMRRLQAERQEEDPAYMAQLDNLEIEFPPYEDPPPPYSPPKPPEIPQGEAPPPYIEHEGDMTGTISSRHQLIPYGEQTTLSNGHSNGVSNGGVTNGDVVSNGLSNGVTRNGGSNVSNGTIRDSHSNNTMNTNSDSRSRSQNSITNAESRNGSVSRNSRNSGSNSQRSNCRGHSRNNSRTGSTNRNNSGSLSRPKSITQSIGTNTTDDLEQGLSNNAPDSQSQTIVRMHNNSPRTSLYRTESEVAGTSRAEGGNETRNPGSNPGDMVHNSSSSLARNLFLKRSGSIEIKCSNSSPRISFYLDDDSRSDIEPIRQSPNPNPINDRMTQSCIEPSTSGSYSASTSAATASPQRSRDVRDAARNSSSTPLLAMPVSTSLASICSETGEARELQAGVSHAGIAPYALPNDACSYPEPAVRSSPRVQSSSRGCSHRRKRSKSRGQEPETPPKPEGKPDGLKSRNDEPMDVSLTSSSSPSSVASQEHHRPRRVIYRDPDFDFDDSSSSPQASQAPVRRRQPGRSSDRDRAPQAEENLSPDEPSPEMDPVKRERIRRRESPETYRRLSQAWDSASKYKQYGFIDPPKDADAAQETIDLPVEKIRSLSKERKRSKSKERQRSNERVDKENGSGERTCPHRRHRHHRSRSGERNSDGSRRRRRSHHSGTYDKSPTSHSPGRRHKRRSGTGGAIDGGGGDAASPGVCQATQVDTTHLEKNAASAGGGVSNQGVRGDSSRGVGVVSHHQNNDTSETGESTRQTADNNNPLTPGSS